MQRTCVVCGKRRMNDMRLRYWARIEQVTGRESAIIELGKRAGRRGGHQAYGLAAGHVMVAASVHEQPVDCDAGRRNRTRDVDRVMIDRLAAGRIWSDDRRRDVVLQPWDLQVRGDRIAAGEQQCHYVAVHFTRLAVRDEHEAGRMQRALVGGCRDDGRAGKRGDKRRGGRENGFHAVLLALSSKSTPTMGPERRVASLRYHGAKTSLKNQAIGYSRLSLAAWMTLAWYSRMRQPCCAKNAAASFGANWNGVPPSRKRLPHVRSITRSTHGDATSVTHERNDGCTPKSAASAPASSGAR